MNQEILFTLNKVLASNKEVLASNRKLMEAIQDNNVEWVDALKGAEIMNSRNPRILQQLRNVGAIRAEVDYYMSGKSFYYRREKLIEIRNRIIKGELIFRKYKQAS